MQLHKKGYIEYYKKITRLIITKITLTKKKAKAAGKTRRELTNHTCLSTHYEKKLYEYIKAKLFNYQFVITNYLTTHLSCSSFYF